jgi:polyvinyl alcohol dehydrogenase (cytochrome)
MRKSVCALGAAILVAAVLAGVSRFPVAGATPRPPVDSWPIYGHDLSNTRLNPLERDVNSRTVGQLTEAWSKSGLVGVVGTPAVSGGNAYFADLTGTLWAVRASSGQVIWRTQIGAGAVSAPAIAANLVFAASGNTLYAVDRASGTIKWKAVTNTNPYAQINASPIVVGSRVIVGTASYEVLVNSPTYSFQGSIAAFDTKTGGRLWNFVTTPNNSSSGAGEGIWSTPAVDKSLGLLYVGTGQNLAPPPGPLEDSILAINYRTGRLVWSMQATKDDVFSLGYPNGFDYDFGASPNLFRSKGRELVGDGDKGGTYYALDARTGNVVWKTMVSPGGSFGGVLGSAALADGKLIVPANMGNAVPEASKVVALDPSSGRVQWTHDLAGHILGPVSAVPGVSFVSSDTGALLALNTATGDPLWSFTAPAQAACGPSVVAGNLLWGYGFTLFNGPGQGGIFDFRIRTSGSR